MNKNALAEKRRETVISLLKGMKIKESAGGEGFEKEAVFGCMQQLCDLYENHISELEKTYEAEIGDLNSKYQKYDENNDIYMSLIMEAKKSRNELIDQAKNEVAAILEEGRKKIEAQEKELVLLRDRNEKERNELAKGLAETKELMEIELAAMKVEVEAEKEKVEAIRSKYRQQTEAMTSDFETIKTNILLTAAKLDGLKNQVETVETEINWDVAETKPVSVEIPAGDIAIEDQIDLEGFDEIEVPEIEVPEELPQEALEALDETQVADFSDIASIIGTEPTEEPVTKTGDLFAEAFFKSEVMEEMPKAEPVAEEPVIEEPVIEEPVIEEPVAVEPVAEQPIDEIVIEDINLEDIDIPEIDIPEIEIPEINPVEDAASAIPEAIFEEEPVIEAEIPVPIVEEVITDNVEEMLEGINFDDILVELPETGAEVAEDGIEEISFDGLEELFKDE